MIKKLLLVVLALSLPGLASAQNWPSSPQWQWSAQSGWQLRPPARPQVVPVNRYLAALECDIGNAVRASPGRIDIESQPVKIEADVKIVRTRINTRSFGISGIPLVPNASLGGQYSPSDQFVAGVTKKYHVKSTTAKSLRQRCSIAGSRRARRSADAYQSWSDNLIEQVTAYRNGEQVGLDGVDFSEDIGVTNGSTTGVALQFFLALNFTQQQSDATTQTISIKIGKPTAGP